MAALQKQDAAVLASVEDILPQVKTLTLGLTEDGKHAVVWITSKGTKVLGRELLFVGTDEQAETAWREEAYHRVWRQEQEPSAQAKLETARRVAPLTGKDVLAGHGFGLCRKDGQWALFEIEHHGDRLTKLQVHEANRDFMYAWERLDILVGRFLVRPRWRAERTSS